MFYKRSGQIEQARGMLGTGMYSAREVSRQLKISINTVCKLLKENENLKCVCGVRLSDHRGWCPFRYQKSEKRQNTVSELMRKKTCKQIERLVAELDPHCKRGSDEFIGGCVLLTILLNGTVNTIHLCLAVDGATPGFVENFCNNLNRQEILEISADLTQGKILTENDDFAVIEFWLYVLVGLGIVVAMKKPKTAHPGA